MMRRMHKFYYCILSLFLFAACQEETLMDGKTTGFQISLQDGEVTVETKSTPVELGKPAVDKFKLKIVKDGASDPLYDGIYTAQTIPASAGTYTISASYGENPVLALDAPYYLGDTSNVVIKDGEKKSVILSCKVANALASAYFPADTELMKIFSSYYVKVLVEGRSCNLTPDSKKSAYFQAGKEVSFYFEGKKRNGEDFSEKLQCKDLPLTLQAGEHLKLTLKLSDDLLLDIAKVEIKKETITSDIPMDWLPKPKIEAEGFENNILSFAETETKTAKLSLNTASPLQDLKLKFTFNDPQFSNLNDKEYLLSVPEDKKEVEKTLGVVLPEIGAEKASLDLTPIVVKLQTDAGATVENKIEVDVRANNRWSSEEISGQENPSRVYTLRCNKPEMVVSVQPGNIWTKEFTVDELTVTTGDPEVIKSKLKYQYKEKSEGDDSWKEIQDMKVLFSEHPQNRSYQVRAVYRDVVMTDVVDVELENPVQLPNSDMEEWSIEEKKKSGGWPFKDKTYYTFHPYSEGNASASWWDTNNDKAQGGTYAIGIWYEGCFASCVSYTTDVHGGSKAALLYLSGCGDGYANTSGTYVGGAMVGSLFIGSYDSNIVQGHDFESRPTSLSFWYKYKPFKSDAFKVVVSLKNEDKEIASGTYVPEVYSVEDETYKQAIVNFDYIEENVKPTMICVQFLASDKTSLTENDFEKGTTIQYPVVGNWTVHMGSILKIDDLSLNYDK